MKKKVFRICCVLLCSLLSGCQEKKKEEMTPSVVATQFLDAYQKKDERKILRYSEWKEFRAKSVEMQEQDYIVGVDKVLQTDIFNMTIAFKHKEFDVKINKDTAMVKVEMTIYDFVPVIQTGREEAIKKASERAKQPNSSDAVAQAEITTIVFKNMKKAKMEKKQIITLQLVQSNGSWLVSNNNKELKDFLFHNMNNLKNYGV